MLGDSAYPKLALGAERYAVSSAELHTDKCHSGQLVRGLRRSSAVNAVFVNTPLHNYDLRPKRHDFTLPVLGLGYIATVASHSDLNVGVLDGEAHGLGFSAIASEVNRRAPEWVGFNLLAPTYAHTVAILQLLDPAIKVMLGGHHAKALPNAILADSKIPRIDALILGEAEYRVAALLRRSSSRDKLPRVFWREGRHVGAGPKTHANSQYLSPDINGMPFVDRSFFAQDPYPDGHDLEAAIVGSRGCPFDCSFCGAAVSANRDIAIRARTPKNLIAELFSLKERYKITAARFVDDLFLANIKMMSECASAFDLEAVNLLWDATGRANVLANVQFSTLDLLKRSGCREIALGIETGSDRLLKYIDKKITLTQIVTAVSRLCGAGINVKGYFILGLPSETRDEHYATLSLIRRLWSLSDGLPGRFRCSVFEYRPYPGTPDWERLVKQEYDVSKLLTYSEVDLTDGGADPLLLDRDEFNFTTDLKFGEVPLVELRRNLSSIMREQKLRLGRHESSVFGAVSQTRSTHRQAVSAVRS